MTDGGGPVGDKSLPTGLLAPYPRGVQIGVLGELLVRTEHGPVPLRRGKPRMVLLSLVMARGDTVPSATLIDRIWRDDPAANPGNALQTLVAYLRRTLAAAGAAPLVTHGVGYALDLSAVELDVLTFEDLLRTAGSSAGSTDAEELERADRLLEQALGLWRGEAYADLSGEDFVAGEVARLDELKVSAAELRSSVLLSLGRHDDAVHALRRLVSEQPLRERLHEQLMVALYRSGRQAEALQAYQDARARLIEELGIEPGADLRRTEQLVLTHDRALDWTPPRAVATAAPAVDPATRRAVPGPVLPVPRSPLVGRDDELARVASFLRAGRTVTVTGPGGAGKSRLAVELARSANQPVRWVDLSPVTADADVAAAVADALGIATPPGVAVLERLRAAACPDPLLIVLDTCEHVVEGAADVVSVLLEAWPSVCVLATSRRPLEIAGELLWTLAPLALPAPADTTVDAVCSTPAVQLFVARATAANPSFRLTEDVAPDVAAICLALDGLPLAIELAAAHADVLSPAVIRARLDERFGLLVRGPRDLLPRQRTLRSTIDWSVQLLTPAERACFAQLAVFHGEFSLDAVVAVSNAGPTETVDLLTALVRQSLVVSVDGGSFQLLDSLRAYAAELLGDDPDAASVRARHALFYAHLAETGDAHMRGRGEAAVLVRLRSELPNFRAALEWSFGGGSPEVGVRIAAALAWFWAHEGMLREAEHWLEQASRIVTADALTRSHVLTRTAMYLLPLGRLHEAQAAAAQGYVIAAQAGDDVRAGAALIELSVAQWALGDLAGASISGHEAIERLARAGDSYGVAMATVLLARTAVDAGAPEADHHLRRALTGIRAVGDAHLTAVALHTAARRCMATGELEKAGDHAREALDLARHVGYQEGIVAGLLLLADVAHRRGEQRQARAVAVEALRMADQIQHLAGTCEGLERLAAILASDGDRHTALTLLLSAQQLRERERLPLRRSDRDRVQELRLDLERSLGPEAAGLAGASALVRPIDLLETVTATAVRTP